MRTQRRKSGNVSEITVIGLAGHQGGIEYFRLPPSNDQNGGNIHASSNIKHIALDPAPSSGSLAMPSPRCYCGDAGGAFDENQWSTMVLCFLALSICHRHDLYSII